MKHQTKNIAQIALMTAIIIVLGFIPPIPLGFIPVPIVLQNLGVMLAGAILGARKGTISVGLFLLMTLLGMPLLSGHSGGPASFFSPSSGYLYAWLVAPFLIGITLKHFNVKSFSMTFVIVWLFGVLLIDLTGAFWLAWYTHTELKATLIANLAFIPGDTIKALLTALISLRIKRQIA